MRELSVVAAPRCSGAVDLRFAARYGTMTKAWPFAVDDVSVTVAVQLAGAVGDATIVN
jgi:hypothetical protein